MAEKKLQFELGGSTVNNSKETPKNWAISKARGILTVPHCVLVLAGSQRKNHAKCGCGLKKEPYCERISDFSCSSVSIMSAREDDQRGAACVIHAIERCSGDGRCFVGVFFPPSTPHLLQFELSFNLNPISSDSIFFSLFCHLSLAMKGNLHLDDLN